MYHNPFPTPDLNFGDLARDSRFSADEAREVAETLESKLQRPVSDAEVIKILTWDVLTNGGVSTGLNRLPVDVINTRLSQK